MNYYSFYTGGEFEAYKYLGAHRTGGKWVFRTFAPQAERVELIFENRVIPMNPIYDGNFYEAYVEEASEGDCYEYRIYGRNQAATDHIDPYGFGMELRPDHRSVIRDLSGYEFHDKRWMKKRGDMLDRPLNIYEIHVGSWRKPGKCPDEWYRYDELAELLIPYLQENHYNYVEVMPICEYPTDESWGYQNTGYFSPTSRYGSALELMKAIDMFHKNDIGVILDFVPVHFALDDYGLKRYDGTSLYEYPNDDVGVSEWGSCNFMHSRGEVKSFLESSANYWLSEYHFDGIRMDAVSRMLYWQGNEKRGENGSAIDFIKRMNMGLKQRNKGIMLIAEDSTNYPGITKSVKAGGLGFDYKWDLGWMHDTLEYFQSLPSERSDKYHKLTFSMMYFRNEKYLLPFSHDEVVHGKASILQKMSGGYEDKFPQARALYMYMMVHPGKKLNFMGNEIGQFREWDEKKEQDWMLLDYPAHDSFHHYMMKLNRIYMSHDAFWQMDYEQEGFSWLDCHSERKCLYGILRTGKESCVAALFNFSDQDRKDYKVKLPERMEAEVLLYTDWEPYGGKTQTGRERVKISGTELSVDLSRFSGMLLKLI